jgi:hypothetical protein
VKVPSGGVSALRMASAVVAVTGPPLPSSSSAWQHLIWWFDGAAYAAMAARVGSKLARGAHYL